MARTSKRAKASKSKNTKTKQGVAPQPGFGPQPNVRPFVIEDVQGLYGLHIPYDVGYDAETQKHCAAGTGYNLDNWNGRLVDQLGSSVDLWITEFDTSFAMGGSTGQSRYHRQFFPRNFTEPIVTVTGRVANTYEYNRLSAFVRRSHYYSLRADEFAADQKQTQGKVSGRHMDSGSAIPTVTLILRGGGIPAAYNAKGVHKPWVVDGYIKSMPAGAKHHDPAPEFKFEFIISQSQYVPATTGIYEDHLVVGSQLLSWMDVFEKNRFRDGSSSPNQETKPWWSDAPAWTVKPLGTKAEPLAKQPLNASGKTDTGNSIWDILTAAL